MKTTKTPYMLLLFILVTLSCLATGYCAPGYYPEYNELDGQQEAILMDLLSKYGQTLINARNDLENSKRTVDFGLSRGYSGAQEAKHRMAMQIANFAGGPGRKRRSGAQQNFKETLSDRLII